MQSVLFTPITLGPNRYPNRIVIAPMAQYSAIDGSPTDWHLMHWGGLATSGAGLVMIEACGVERDGRPTPGDVGLYSDANEAALQKTLASIRAYVPVKFGAQLFHGGRKGSAAVHWEGGGPISKADGGWDTIAPSAIPYNDGWPVPREMTDADLDRVEAAHVAAVLRAANAGFDCVELHAAHGYLLHQFLSSVSNRRSDIWGGTLENRLRYPLRVFDAVAKAAPPHMTLGVRLTGSDWIADGGITPDEAIAFARELEARGCHYVDVTSGGLDPRLQSIAVGPGYQVGFAEAVKRAVKIPVRAVGLIVTPEQAEEIVASGKADLIAIARAALANPHWPWQAAHALGATIDVPKQYARAQSGTWPGWDHRR